MSDNFIMLCILACMGLPTVIVVWLAIRFDIGNNKKIYMPRAPDKKPK